jgi:hypothetical protein
MKESLNRPAPDTNKIQVKEIVDMMNETNFSFGRQTAG